MAEDDEQAPVAVAAAKAQAAETAVAACERSIQVHGGIGFTWEHVLHRYYKRAQWIDAFGGHAAVQRRVVAAALLDVERRSDSPVPKEEVLELMRMEVDPAEVDEIRELWKSHSKAEDNRSIEGLLATLSEDCVYTVYPDDVSWHGHEGAARFYTELLTAFPDIVFELQNIVIGPQGVVEEAIVTGTHRAKWLDNEPTGETMTWRNAIFFPWRPRVAPLQGRARLHRHAAAGRMMGHAFSSLDELGDGYGFRKVRGALGVTAFGVNGVVYPPGHPGIHHYHDTQDEALLRAQRHGQGGGGGRDGLRRAQRHVPRVLLTTSRKRLRPNPNADFEADRVAMVAKIGENIKIARNARMEVSGNGLIAAYIHTGAKVGVLVEVGAGKETTAQG